MTDQQARFIEVARRYRSEQADLIAKREAAEVANTEHREANKRFHLTIKEFSAAAEAHANALIQEQDRLP